MNNKISYNKKKSITSLDVAKLAGVSQSTVSRVFNRNWKGNIHEDIREKVLNASKKLGYTPNAIAQILNSKRSGIIGVVVSKEYDEFYYEVLNKLVNVINSKGLHTMIFTSEPLGNINDVIDSMVSYQVDGVIITSSAISHQVECRINDLSMPIVLFNGYLSGLDVSAVQSDNYGACIMMADYLVETGHKSFAYISTDKSKYLNYLPRQESFLYGLSRHGINNCKISPASYSYESGVEAASQLITEKGYPDAIFCASDKPALGAIDFARDFGLKVGRDISITGFYAPVGVDLPSYSLTCLKQDIEGLSEDAVDLLIEKIEDPGVNSRIITRPMKLEIGNSSKAKL